MTTWTVPQPPAVDGPTTGPERPILEGMLAWQRRTLVNICAGLSAEQLAAHPLPSTNLSLLGLVRHLAKVERIWLRQRAGQQQVGPLYPPELGKDADFDEIDAADAPAALERLQEEWREADLAAAPLDLEHPVEAHGETLSLRMVYVHLIGEYSRHNGHADLLREALDGSSSR